MEKGTVLALLRAAEQTARNLENGPSPADLAWCLARVLGLDRSGLLLEPDRLLGEAERASFQGMLRRLLSGEPLAYVLGTAVFRGLELEVNPSVLIPRPETEGLVDLAVERLPEGGRVFEPCTGSGCIALSLHLERPDLEILASDLSGEALEVARRNAARHGADPARLSFERGSFWEPAGGRVFDALIANPPYVDPDRPELLEASVREYEPQEALFSRGRDALQAFRALLEGGRKGLRAGGLVLLEAGMDTAGPLLSLLLQDRAFAGGELVEDFRGLPRYLVCHRGGRPPAQSQR